MDKDLAAAMMLERCACYDRALESARKVLEKSSSERVNLEIKEI